MSRFKRKVDGNQPKVVEQLRALGFTVALTHTVAGGFPDFVVGIYGVNFLVELKITSKSKLTPDEEEFAKTWQGQVFMGTTVEEIVAGFHEYVSRQPRLIPSAIEFALSAKKRAREMFSADAVYVEEVDND